jgi:hypothetical protein
VGYRWLLAAGHWRLAAGFAHLLRAVRLWFSQQQDASSKKLEAQQFSLF